MESFDRIRKDILEVTNNVDKILARSSENLND